MTADGVQRGYAEVRVAMASKRRSLGERPWHRKTTKRRTAASVAAAPDGTPNDWAKQLRDLSGAPPMARADGAASPALQQSGEAFRSVIAEERQRELEYSRYLRAKEREA